MECTKRSTAWHVLNIVYSTPYSPHLVVYNGFCMLETVLFVQYVYNGALYSPIPCLSIPKKQKKLQSILLWIIDHLLLPPHPCPDTSKLYLQFSN